MDYSIRDAKTLYDVATIPHDNARGDYRKNVSDKQRKFMIKLGFNASQIDAMNQKKASAAIDYAIRNPRNGYARWIHNKKKQEGTL